MRPTRRSSRSSTKASPRTPPSTGPRDSCSAPPCAQWWPNATATGALRPSTTPRPTPTSHAWPTRPWPPASATAYAASRLHTTPPDPQQALQLAIDAETHARDTGLVWGRISGLLVIARADPNQAHTALTTALHLATSIRDGRAEHIHGLLDRAA